MLVLVFVVSVFDCGCFLGFYLFNCLVGLLIWMFEFVGFYVIV